MSNEKLHVVENTAQEANGLVDTILADPELKGTLDCLDAYVEKVKTVFNAEKDIILDDLNKIALQLSTYVYGLTELAQRIEIKKGLAKENSKFNLNEAFLGATGTVAEKTARSENATVEDRITQLAYATATGIVNKKLDAVTLLLDSVKKVQQCKMMEMKLTGMAGSSVGGF